MGYKSKECLLDPTSLSVCVSKRIKMLKLFLITFLCVTAYAQPIFFEPNTFLTLWSKLIGNMESQMMSNKNNIVQQQQSQQPSNNRPPPPLEPMTRTTTWATTAATA